MASCPPPQPPNNPRGNKSVTRITSRVLIEQEEVPPQTNQRTPRTPGNSQRPAIAGGRQTATPYYTPRQCPSTPRTGGGRGASTPYYTPRQYPATPTMTPSSWQASLRTQTPSRPCPKTSRATRLARPTPSAPPTSPTGSGRVRCPRLPNLTRGTNTMDDLNATYTVADGGLNSTYTVPDLNGTYTVPGLNNTYTVPDLNNTYTVPDLNDTYTVDDRFGQTYSVPSANETYTLESSLWANASSSPCPADVSYQSTSTDDSTRAHVNFPSDYQYFTPSESSEGDSLTTHVNYPSDYQYFSNQTTSSEEDSLRARVNYPSDYQYFSNQTTSSEEDSLRARVNYPSDYQYLSESSDACTPPRGNCTTCPQEQVAGPSYAPPPPKRYGTPLATSSPTRLQPTQPWRNSTSPIGQPGSPSTSCPASSPGSYQPRSPGTPTSFDQRWTAFADTPASSKRNLRTPREVPDEFSSNYEPIQFSQMSNYSEPPSSWGCQHSSEISPCPTTSFQGPLDSSEERRMLGIEKTPPIACENMDPWSPPMRSNPSVYSPEEEDWDTLSSEDPPQYQPLQSCPKKGKNQKQKFNWYYNKKR